MDQLFLPALIAVTSAGTYLVWARAAGLSARPLWAAVGKMLECAGLTVVFLGVNVAVGTTAALAARSFLSTFVSLYPLADATLVGLSLLQAITFQWWHELSNLPRR